MIPFVNFQQATGGLLSSIFLSMSLVAPFSDVGEVASTMTAGSKADSSSPSITENYLPRRLYPGTYGQFCGPTPEIQVRQACAVHGWHGDAPQDKVDAACQQHDISYCQCETQLLQRRQNRQLSLQTASLIQRNDASQLEEVPLLSSMIALRFAVKPALDRVAPLDQEYFDCIHKADQQIVATGITVRSEMQRTGCSIDPSLSWFCETGKGTLDVFEKVNLDIFLRDLDFDDQPKVAQKPTLKQLEAKRQKDLRFELRNGKSLADAASSVSVQDDEVEIYRQLQVGTRDGFSR